MNSVGTSSFFGFEGLRIIVPGILGLGLAQAVLDTVAPALYETSGLRETSTAVAFSLALGIFLYFVDLPSRSPVAAQADPSRTFQEIINYEGKPYLTKNHYYIAFDTVLPVALRERSSYFTAIFRIGFEAILLTSTAALVVFLLRDMCRVIQMSRFVFPCFFG